MVLSQTASISCAIQELLPPPEHTLYLWRIYQSNVYPLTYFFAAWQKEELILSALAGLQEPRSSTLAFLFNMYCLAIYSLSEEECVHVMGKSRDTLLDRYQVSHNSGSQVTGLIEARQSVL